MCRYVCSCYFRPQHPKVVAIITEGLSPKSFINRKHNWQDSKPQHPDHHVHRFLNRVWAHILRVIGQLGLEDFIRPTLKVSILSIPIHSCFYPFNSIDESTGLPMRNFKAFSCDNIQSLPLSTLFLLLCVAAGLTTVVTNTASCQTAQPLRQEVISPVRNDSFNKNGQCREKKTWWESENHRLSFAFRRRK